MARGLRERLRRGGEPDRPLAALLADPGTVRAAAAAFDLVGRPDASWWPCAALVGPDRVSLRLAGLTVPAARAPWRVGHDARVWTADRDALTPETEAEVDTEVEVEVETQEPAEPAPDRRPLLIGRFDDMVVFVDTRRAPGPVLVTGESESVGRVRDLIDRQASGRSSDLRAGTDTETRAQTQAGLGAGAHWPLDVEGDVIRFLGLAVATTLSAVETEQAIDLVRRANAADDPTDVAQLEYAPGEASAAPGDEPWAFAGEQRHQAFEPPFRVDRESSLAAETAGSAETAPAPVPADPVEDEPDPFAFAVSAQPAAPARPAPAEPAPEFIPETVPQTTPTPARAPDNADGLDDWASGFAVSSADD